VQSAAAPLELVPLQVAPLDTWLPRLAGGPDVATPVSWLAATAPAATTAPAVTAGVWAFRRRHTRQQQWYMLHITPMHVAATPTPTYSASWTSSDIAVPVVVSTYAQQYHISKIAQNTIFLCLQAREGCDICTKHNQSIQQLPA
jgi:hypothetical protein